MDIQITDKKELIKVVDEKGFHYEVQLEHSPQHGFSTAFYNGRIIAQCELGRILQPMSDDNREWEMYEERFGEWKDEIKTNIIPACQEYLNTQPQ